MAIGTNFKGVGQASTSLLDPIASGSSQINLGANERYLSAGAGALLLTIGLRRGGLKGLVLAALGGVLVYRGASGYSTISKALGRESLADASETDVEAIEGRVSINRPRDEVYQFWRKLENLPQFMHHLESVTQIDQKRSHWVARFNSDNKLASVLPTISWDAEIVEEDENARLVWRSVPGATVDNSGEVRFVDDPSGTGTEVFVTIRYRAPEGTVGELVMKLANPAFKKLVSDDILRFKRLLETGSLPVRDYGSKGHRSAIL